MSNCISCGASLPEGAAFCPMCGAKQAKTCPSCGAVLDANFAFCPKCGTKVGAAAAPAAKSQCRVNDTLKMGSYDQNGIGAEPIEWIVLAVEGEKALVISKYALEVSKYHDGLSQLSDGSCTSRDATWDSCTLRSFLNGDFLKKAFTKSEQNRIYLTELAAEDYMKAVDAEEYPAKATVDKIFCLSVAEAEKYTDPELRKCKATAAAVSRGEYEGVCGWWLRNPGWSSGNASHVDSDGYIQDRGAHQFFFYGVRPAMWIKL